MLVLFDDVGRMVWGKRQHQDFRLKVEVFGCWQKPLPTCVTKTPAEPSQGLFEIV